MEKNANITYGNYAVTISTKQTLYTITSVDYCTKVLYASDAANFKTILTENADGYFVLGEDLDFGGVQLAGTIEFSGTLDGNGYALKNFELHHNASSEAEGWVSYFIYKNTGTIKNLKIEYIFGSGNSNPSAFIGHNEGTIENVMVDVVFNGYAWNTAALAGTNKGIIKNCVIVMEIGTLTELSRIGGIVATDYNGTMQNCYVVHNGILEGAEDRMYLDTWNNGTMQNCTSYATMAELAAVADFSADNGWCKYWSIANEEVLFGDE